MKVILNCFFISLLLCANVIAASVIPPKETNPEIAAKSDTHDLNVTFDKGITRHLIPGYYYPAINSYIPDDFYNVPTEINESRSMEETVEPRTIPFLLNFIILPKIILKFVKKFAFAVSVATTIGGIFFLLSATICTFTPICVLGLAIPGLRNAERAGRNIVQNLSEHIPGEKIEAAAEILSNVLDKYAKIRITQSKKIE